MSEPRHRIEVIIEPGFVPVELASVIDVLRVANRLSFQRVFCWHLVSTSMMGLVESLGGLSAQASGVQNADELRDGVIVCGGDSIQSAFAAIAQRIQRYKRAGRPVVLLSDAASQWILGRKDDRSVAAHWENQTWMNELQPDLQVGMQLYHQAAKVTTAAGMLGTADVVLRLVAQMESAILANDISRVLVMERIRDAETPQWAADSPIERPFLPKLAQVIRLMESHIEQPMTMAEIANQTGISARQIERYFHRHVALSPMAYYRRLRIRRGHLLLKQTALPVTEIALICGFTSHSNFTARYRDEFGITPSQFRRSLV